MVDLSAGVRRRRDRLAVDPATLLDAGGAGLAGHECGAVGDAHDRDHAAGVDLVVSDRKLQPCSAPADAGVAGVDRLLPDLLHALRPNLLLFDTVFSPRAESHTAITWLALRGHRSCPDFPSPSFHSLYEPTPHWVVALAGPPRS